MNQVFVSNIFLLIILALAIIGKNDMLSVSVAFLLLISLVGQIGNSFQEVSRNILIWSDKYGLKLGVIILMIGVLSPIALGEMKMSDIIELGRNKEGIIAVVAGIIVAMLASKGGYLLESDPKIVFSLVFGTVIGVVAFRGYPVGPLVASGIAACILQIVGFFK